jgi:DNA-binding beta-propeller fold protein YncE
MKKLTRALTVAAGACGLVLPLAVPATADGHPLPPGVSVVADELAGPLQVEVGPNGTVYVAEAFAGQVTALDKKGQRSVLASGLGFSPGLGVHGGQVFVTASSFSEGEGPDDPGSQTSAELLRFSQGGRLTHSVDLLAYELRVNPDGQVQFDPETGQELDALTNPYDVLALPGRTLIADAGANVVNQVLANGQISTLTVLPVSTDGDCATQQNNTGVGCDPVPTGIVLGPDGFLYVSGLGGEVEGHVWRIDPRSGAIVATWSGLPPLTGIAVAPDGTLYVSSIDFATFGGLVLRLDALTRQVTGTLELEGMPATGLTWAGGRLLVASGFTGLLLGVEPGAFAQP